MQCMQTALCCAGPAAAASSSQLRLQSTLPHPGDQLAGVMSSPSNDNLFLDPTWRDPDILGAGPNSQELLQRKPPPPPAAARPSSSLPSAADDPFSQLSLSRGPSGEPIARLYHWQLSCTEIALVLDAKHLKEKLLSMMSFCEIMLKHLVAAVLRKTSSAHWQECSLQILSATTVGMHALPVCLPRLSKKTMSSARPRARLSPWSGHISPNQLGFA